MDPTAYQCAAPPAQRQNVCWVPEATKQLSGERSLAGRRPISRTQSSPPAGVQRRCAQPPNGSNIRKVEPVTTEPLIHSVKTPDSTDRVVQHPSIERPLAGVRVLDLTRVLAGPVATRFLAGYGAEVLRIDPPDWDEPGVVPEVTLGKRCTRVNLKASAGRECFTGLLRQADVLVHGYHPSALAALGFDEETLRKNAPGLIDVSHSRRLSWFGTASAYR